MTISDVTPPDYSTDFGFKVVPGAAIAFELPGEDAQTNNMELAKMITGLEHGN